MVVSRRDRSLRPNRGGVIIYAHQDLNNVVALKESAHAERLWCLVQRDKGDIAICNWYLPPGNSREEIDCCRDELTEMSNLAESIIIAGDLNTHHKS